MAHRMRTEPCEILRRDGVACVLWLEDAIANYNVPTCGFDLFILVPDPDNAAASLRRAGWTDAGIDSRRCPYLAEPRHAHLVCLDPPFMEEPPDYVPGILPPPPSGPAPPTRTVLLSAKDCNAPLEPLGLSAALTDSIVPPLAFLVDGLIAGVLDTPPLSQLEARLAMQLVYLYGYCPGMYSPGLIEELRLENRQFHIDALTGPAVGKAPLIRWNRQVRRELLNGTRQVIHENSLLSSNPADLQRFISSTRSYFRPLSQAKEPEHSSR